MICIVAAISLRRITRSIFCVGDSCSSANALRLNQAGYFTNSRSGRVEICHCSQAPFECQWASVPVPTSSVSWGWKNTLVACRELYPLGDYGAANPILQDSYVHINITVCQWDACHLFTLTVSYMQNKHIQIQEHQQYHSQYTCK